MWTYEYHNDTGPGDDGFWQWWDLLKDGEKVGRAFNESTAKEICDALNTKIEAESRL